jgi:hypothetical protein
VKAKKANDDRCGLPRKADALDIEAQAKRRLADEYDAAQARGEVATIGKGRQVGRFRQVGKSNQRAVAADVGLTKQEIHEARQIRDAEKRDRGTVRRTVKAAEKF